MLSLPTLPRPPWLKRFSITVLGALILLSASVLLGWLMDVPGLTFWHTGWEPMDASGALGLLWLGVVLLAVQLGRREFAWSALGPTLLGALTLLQELLGPNRGVDQWLMSDGVGSPLVSPGRTAPAVACALALVGAAVTLLASRRGSRQRTLSLALVSSLTLAIGASTLLGYALELRAVYRWGMGNDTAPLSALALCLLGAALLSLAWQEHRALKPGAPAWLPLPVVVASATLTVILWVGLRQREVDYLGTTTQISINGLAGAVNLELERQLNATERIARRWSQPVANRIIWEVDATTHLAETQALLAVGRVGPDLRTQWLHPPAGHEHLAQLDHSLDPVRARALELARTTGLPVISGSLAQPPFDSGFAIYAPIMRGDTLDGFVVADYAYRPLFAELVQRLKLATDYTCAINVGGDWVYGDPGSADAEAVSTARQREALDPVFTIFDRRVRIRLAPSEEFFRRFRRFLPELALAAGFGITVLLGLSVHLARAAYTSLREAERSNQRLLAENEERRRVEAMLMVSDERLRLALDSTQMGILEWNLLSNQLFYSPGLWTLLGYTPGQIGTTPEAWNALVHPDDLPAYRAAVDLQLRGDAAFIDPEFRVRTGSGDWRWLYARAKTVSRSASGAPLRIIGTLQDITDRKAAEAALRESQATTRKLSLVASRTDNLVIIASPEGRIEWVNESFTRVMEFTLEEARGQSPATIMVGPETDRRTIRRIGAATARGSGLSCDIVNYSKSGRKYHLHLEIQPVRNEAGELETFIAVLADITDRVETERALRRAKAEADAASRSKSEFLASMSHEIRTPMNGVIGMTSLLLESELDLEQRDYVNTIRLSGEALLTIINDILDFSKIESGKMELERVPLHLATCVEETLELFALPAATKKLDLVYHLEDDVPPWILGDVTRLRQVLVNLVNNAVKFTPAGSVAITARLLPRTTAAAAELPPGALLVEFAVRDTGIGIPADRIDRLFKPFSQVDSSTTRRFGGTGLGLAICHRLCTLMGGGVTVHSEPGTGSTFVFTLVTEAALGRPSTAPQLPAALRPGGVLCVEAHPLNQRRFATFFQRSQVPCTFVASAGAALPLLHSAAPPPAVLVVDQALLEGPDGIELSRHLAASPTRLLLLTAPGSSGSAAPFGARSAALAKPVKTTALLRNLQTLYERDDPTRPVVLAAPHALLAQEIPLQVLLVEDNAVNQKVALRFLARLGYQATSALNGRDAVAAVEQGAFDLVLMDLQMPEMDGFEAAREIRRRLPVARQPRIVALTANALQGDRELCLAAGMDDYLTKPIKPAELETMIRTQFATRARPPEPAA